MINCFFGGVMDRIFFSTSISTSHLISNIKKLLRRQQTATVKNWMKTAELHCCRHGAKVSNGYKNKCGCIIVRFPYEQSFHFRSGYEHQPADDSFLCHCSLHLCYTHIAHTRKHPKERWYISAVCIPSRRCVYMLYGRYKFKKLLGRGTHAHQY